MKELQNTAEQPKKRSRGRPKLDKDNKKKTCTFALAKNEIDNLELLLCKYKNINKSKFFSLIIQKIVPLLQQHYYDKKSPFSVENISILQTENYIFCQKLIEILGIELVSNFDEVDKNIDYLLQRKGRIYNAQDRNNEAKILLKTIEAKLKKD